MKILTEAGQALNLTTIPSDIRSDRHLCVFDPLVSDFTFQPIIFTESFRAAPALLNIGGHKLALPMGWHILCYDHQTGDVEAIPLTECERTSFDALAFHPLAPSQHKGWPITIRKGEVNTGWTMPRVLGDVAIAVPLGDSCVFLIKNGFNWSPMHIADMV